MDLDAKTKFGRLNNGCRFQAVVLAVFLGCLHVSAGDNDALRRAPDAALSLALAPQVYQWGALFALGLVLAMALVLAALRWHRKVLQRRDDEVFQLIDEWTKSLQQEVSERKQAQKALQESHEFITRQERLAAVGQLAAGLAHEFNNIMTIVQGHASMLMDNPNLDEESVKSLTHITDGVERMAKLIRQMLAFSSKQVMQQKVLDLRENLGHTSEMLGRLLGEQVALRFKIAPRLPVVFSSGYSQGMVERSVYASQCIFYLSKPYNPVQLALAVRHALDAARELETPVAAPAA